MTKQESATAYPLAWPDGWPRAANREPTHPFGGKVYNLSFDRQRLELLDELRRLGARDVVLSTNVRLRGDGQPAAAEASKRMSDPGVAVYFTLKRRPLVMARDTYTDIAANMRSLFKAIEGLRQLERHGGTYMMDRAFSGFTALPPPPTPWQRLGISPGSPAETIRTAFKARAREPGNSGDMDLLVKARDAALKEIGQ